jgi:hypothetical protein
MLDRLGDCNVVRYSEEYETECAQLIELSYLRCRDFSWS